MHIYVEAFVLKSLWETSVSLHYESMKKLLMALTEFFLRHRDTLLEVLLKI